MKFVSKLLGAALAVALLTPVSTFAQKAEKAKDAKAAVSKAAANAPTDKEIADAKAKGLVWVNTNSGVWHTEGQFYGHTKEGQFMTTADATKAGYRAAKENAVEKKAKEKAETAATDSTDAKKGKKK